jgi:hypothetical protein
MVATYADDSHIFKTGRGLNFPVSWVQGNPPCVVQDTTDELGEEMHKSWQTRLIPNKWFGRF